MGCCCCGGGVVVDLSKKDVREVAGGAGSAGRIRLWILYIWECWVVIGILGEEGFLYSTFLRNRLPYF